eukprot:48431-Eustigmatos_ZCMA.PRE.1
MATSNVRASSFSNLYPLPPSSASRDPTGGTSLERTVGGGTSDQQEVGNGNPALEAGADGGTIAALAREWLATGNGESLWPPMTAHPPYMLLGVH